MCHAEHIADNMVECREAAERCVNYVQHSVLILLVEAATKGCIELVEQLPNHFKIDLLAAFSHHHLHLEVFELSTHVQKDEYFNDAPQAVEVCWTTKNDEFVTTPC